MFSVSGKFLSKKYYGPSTLLYTYNERSTWIIVQKNKCMDHMSLKWHFRGTLGNQICGAFNASMIFMFRQTLRVAFYTADELLYGENTISAMINKFPLCFCFCSLCAPVLTLL